MEDTRTNIDPHTGKTRPAVKSVEMPKVSNPDLDGFDTGTDTPFKNNEVVPEEEAAKIDSPVPLGTDNTAAAPSQPDDCGSVKESSSVPEPVETVVNEPPPKPTPPIIAFTFQTERDGKPVSFITNEIKKRIADFQIPNATVDTDYEFIFDFSIDELKIVSEQPEAQPKINSTLTDNGFSVELLEGNRIRFYGKPKMDYNGKIYFLHQTAEAFQEKQSKRAEGQSEPLYNNFQDSKPFIINAHPKSLWKDLPCVGTDENGNPYDNYGDYENADSVSSGEVVSYTSAKSFEVIAASIRGRSHAHVGKPRDDAYYYEFDGRQQTADGSNAGWNFITVADGAGSAKHSRKGSEIATRTIVQTLRSALTAEFTKVIFTDRMEQIQRWKNEFADADGKLAPETEKEFVEKSQLDKVLYIAVREAFVKIHNEAEEYKKKHPDTKINDYNTTLLAAAFRWFPELNDGKGGWFIVSYWVGDGGATILDDTADAVGGSRKTPRKVFVLGEPDGGEFAGQTRFLTMKEEITEEKVRKRLRFTFCDSFEAMLLVTDGITDPFFPSEAAVVDEPRWLEFYEKKFKGGCYEEPDGCKEIFDDTIDPQKKSEALLKWLKFWSKGNHDDRTVLIVRPTTFVKPNN
ncbi:MAG: protein phosphatase 2C domain-containing protein [Planctomycetaceae bacterium]|nr:protein phosphatase 2C domain-containing protein [Planctomycetaceae bacterium]